MEADLSWKESSFTSLNFVKIKLDSFKSAHSLMTVPENPTESLPQQTKADLRRSLLKTRQSISKEQWRKKSDRICNHLQNSAQFQQAKTILAYLSFRKEPDLSPLISNHHQWGFPRCVDDSLSWHLWKPNDILQKGAYGILEPSPDAPILKPAEIDLILIPAIACDKRGYRLGYGGGFYDRMLSLPQWQSIPTIGIIFAFAYLPQLPVESWDKPLNGICTENQLIYGF